MSDSASDPGSITNPMKFKNQDFVSLRDECLQSGKLFVDPSFTADQNSIGMPADPDPKMAIKWLRPKEISSNAVFVEGTTGTTDICQGQLGNCWLLASLSCLTMHPTLFEKVVPSGQTMDASYAGIFRFRFWQYGEWVEVVVDDRLPVRGGRLLFSYSRTKNEFWSALVEKAYAKLIGSYNSLKGGNISEGMEDFTGGIAYTRPVSSRTPPVLWRTLTAALSRGSLLSCFIQAKSVKEIGSVTPEGLVKGHAYAITATDKVHKKAEEVLLVRLRNPWGFVEFCGPWSDKSKVWDGIDSAEKTRIKLNIEEDGEFWIGVQDFCKLFDTVELCSVEPDSDAGEEGNATDISSWSLTSHKGSWVPMCSAGGSRKNARTFCKNPQFHLVLSQQDVEDVELDEDDLDGRDDDDDGAAAQAKSSVDKHKEKIKKCTVLIELLQKDRRLKDKVNFLYIGYHIYKVPPELQDSTGSFSQAFFDANPLVGRSGQYRNVRAVWRKVHLDPGHYIIVVSTQRPNQPGVFFLRIYAKKGNTLGVREITCPTAFTTTVMSNPPSPEDQRMVQKWFDEQAGPDDKLNALEFMKLLNTVLEKDYHVPLETCRQLIFTQDTGGRGRLSRDQADNLLSTLRSLQSIFLEHDEDSSGTISPFELSQTLKAAGMQCDNNILHMLWERFGSGEQQLPFYIFVSCVTRLQVLFSLFESESSLEVKSRGINEWLLRLLAV
ncbi:calpain-12 isoform X1 [Ictalurus punctatus]|uniref:Calpain-12 isoform X1 n=1 Tax=Ictalurus punctatus TaxID=7998 RepID=A0A2D0QTS0_ICTPU|nr:calpain-12 isoform X1 [Ictalurus punctatus]